MMNKMIPALKANQDLKYDVKDLFNLETNVGFQWLEDTLLPAGKEDVIRQVSEEFNIPSFDRLFVMKKRSRSSRLYRIATSQGDYVLRSVPSSLSNVSETQCEIANQVKGSNIIQPLRSRRGSYTRELGERVWIVYHYIPGDVFSGDPRKLFPILDECLGLIQTLKEISDTKGLYSIFHRRKLWRESFVQLINSEDLISTGKKNLLAENRITILRLFEGIARLDPVADIALTHNDLNHANIILHKG